MEEEEDGLITMATLLPRIKKILSLPLSHPIRGPSLQSAAESDRMWWGVVSRVLFGVSTAAAHGKIEEIRFFD